MQEWIHRKTDIKVINDDSSNRQSIMGNNKKDLHPTMGAIVNNHDDNVYPSLNQNVGYICK